MSEAEVIDDPTTGDSTVDAGNDTIAADDSKTIADGGDDTAPAIQADWPDDWRSKLAGEDAKLAKRLDRFQSPKDIMTSYLAAEQKIAEGAKGPELPENATDEQLAEYRKAIGVPETHEAYFESLPDGLVIGEDDKELAGSFAEALHAVNAPAPVAAAAIGWYQQRQEDAATAQSEADTQYHQKAEDELRAEWGGEFRANANIVQSFLDSTPQTEEGTAVGDLLRGARLPDGTVAGNNPAVLKWLVSLAQDANPAGFLSPSEGTSQVEGVQSEIQEIEKFMSENPKAYYKDEAKQARLRQLYEAQEKLASK